LIVFHFFLLFSKSKHFCKYEQFLKHDRFFKEWTFSIFEHFSKFEYFLSDQFSNLNFLKLNIFRICIFPKLAFFESSTSK
jgi:hypothetical protein